MNTKNAKTAYSQYLNLSFLDSATPKIKNKSSLLTPTRMSNKVDDQRAEQPAYRVAKYIDTIRNSNPKKKVI